MPSPTTDNTTAILATSDRLATGVIQAAGSHQLRVSQDLAVIGFDDIPTAKLITPKANDGASTYGRKGTPSRIIVAERKKDATDEGTDEACHSPVDGPRDPATGSGDGNYPELSLWPFFAQSSELKSGVASQSNRKSAVSGNACSVSASLTLTREFPNYTRGEAQKTPISNIIPRAPGVTVERAMGLIVFGLTTSLAACQSQGTSNKSAQITEPNVVFSQGGAQTSSANGTTKGVSSRRARGFSRGADADSQNP
jgi:Periplasmic binding protein-like domain